MLPTRHFPAAASDPLLSISPRLLINSTNIFASSSTPYRSLARSTPLIPLAVVEILPHRRGRGAGWAAGREVKASLRVFLPKPGSDPGAHEVPGAAAVDEDFDKAVTEESLCQQLNRYATVKIDSVVIRRAEVGSASSHAVVNDGTRVVGTTAAGCVVPWLLRAGVGGTAVGFGGAAVGGNSPELCRAGVGGPVCCSVAFFGERSLPAGVAPAVKEQPAEFDKQGGCTPQALVPQDEQCANSNHFGGLVELGVVSVQAELHQEVSYVVLGVVPASEWPQLVVNKFGDSAIGLSWLPARTFYGDSARAGLDDLPRGFSPGHVNLAPRTGPEARPHHRHGAVTKLWRRFKEPPLAPKLLAGAVGAEHSICFKQLAETSDAWPAHADMLPEVHVRDRIKDGQHKPAGGGGGRRTAPTKAKSGPAPHRAAGAPAFPVAGRPSAATRLLELHPMSARDAATAAQLRCQQQQQRRRRRKQQRGSDPAASAGQSKSKGAAAAWHEELLDLLDQDTILRGLVAPCVQDGPAAVSVAAWGPSPEAMQQGSREQAVDEQQAAYEEQQAALDDTLLLLERM
ncbi:MAG: hypothetical protein BJ554DRAFT_6762 [Olpidium bornovanus]|uniref:Uncharacterized protein n=1 Tax=Olpidium bornovanus TaxID=278681 RepID=A0A8H8A251_9FUNG|nr:MAG: hypothetical protein BJ554DRAFT_6762 [Olpidium bornovanus]